MSLTEAKTRRFTVDEYYQLADLGLFRDQRVELIDGEIIEMAPQRDLHAAALGLTARALATVSGPTIGSDGNFRCTSGRGWSPSPMCP